MGTLLDLLFKPQISVDRLRLPNQVQAKRIHPHPHSLLVRADAIWETLSLRSTSDFEKEGTIADQFVSTLSLEDYTAAKERLASLDKMPLSLAQKDLWRKVYDACHGEWPRNCVWGENPLWDALKIRFIRQSAATNDLHTKAKVVWYGILFDIGARVQEIDLRKLPPETLRTAICGVAATDGYAKALLIARDLFGTHSAVGVSDFEWLSLLALRCVLEGRFTPDVIDCLIPPLVPGDSLDLWRAARFALRRILEKRNQAGLAFILTRIINNAFRSALAAKTSSESIKLESLGLTTELTDDQRKQLSELVSRYSASSWIPWEDGEAMFVALESGVDLLALDVFAQESMEACSQEMIWKIYLDPSLIRASLFAILGNRVSMDTYLNSKISACRSPLPTEERSSIAEKIRMTRARPDAFSVFADLFSLNQEDQQTYEALQAAPDPNVVLGTPSWLLDGRSIHRIAGPLAKAGMKKLKDVKSVRTILMRKELRKGYERFWLLDKSEMENLLKTIDFLCKLDTYPEKRAWIGVLKKMVGTTARTNR